jgi:hypothetical protein
MIATCQYIGPDRKDFLGACGVPGLDIPVGLKYKIRPLICGFLVVSTGDLVLVDKSAEDRAVDVVLGEVDGARGSGLGLRWTEPALGAVRPLSIGVLQVPGEGSAQVPFVEDERPVEEPALLFIRRRKASYFRRMVGWIGRGTPLSELRAADRWTPPDSPIAVVHPLYAGPCTGAP